MARRPPLRKRPTPPPGVAALDDAIGRFAPAPEVLEWLRTEILAEDGTIHNPDHQHLLDADLQVLWAPGPFASKGRGVIGTAEEVAFRCNAWQRGRQEQQLVEWFGHVPTYLITLAASYCATCSDVDFCALVEHELYHVGHQLNEFGVPMFTRDGEPKLHIRGHDVEEFVGVARRYGVGDPGGALARLAAAARENPQVSRGQIAGACGTCLPKAA
jgi:Putative phage metallopeptidase